MPYWSPDYEMIMSESHSRESLTARSGRSHKMAEEPQQKKSKVQSDGYKEAFLAVFPELVDCVTKDELGSSEIGAAFGHFKSVSCRLLVLSVTASDSFLYCCSSSA